MKGHKPSEQAQQQDQQQDENDDLEVARAAQQGGQEDLKLVLPAADQRQPSTAPHTLDMPPTLA